MKKYELKCSLVRLVDKLNVRKNSEEEELGNCNFNCTLQNERNKNFLKEEVLKCMLCETLQKTLKDGAHFVELKNPLSCFLRDRHQKVKEFHLKNTI